ncbi:hypothetical protein [Acidocella aromatica]|uniref:Uncharacterized protein n=1 Tax=Acidocella aromatica TaxID=1303579 RepID=A0A840VRV2_9PROT|nr:hypothetical protein [Acidocella aromatica]MBB5374321.1 hypothetical protein [Acidocella aromatica]
MTEIKPTNSTPNPTAPTDEALIRRDLYWEDFIKSQRAEIKERFTHLVVSLDQAAQERIRTSCDLPPMPPWWWERVEMHLENYRVSKLPKFSPQVIAAAKRLRFELNPYCSEISHPALVDELDTFLEAAEFSEKMDRPKQPKRPTNHEDPAVIAFLGSLWKYAMKRNPGATTEGPFARFLIATLNEVSIPMQGRTIRKHVETLLQPPWYTKDGEWALFPPPPHETP